MTLNIIPKKPFTSYTDSEQQAILSRGQAILAQKLEQGESRSQEDTWCMTAYQRTQRAIRFKPTVEKIVKEKPLTKAQKLELLNESIALQEEELSDKHKLVLEELVGLDKEYYVFTDIHNVKVLMKLTKTNIKKQVKELYARGQLCLASGSWLSEELSKSEQEFLTAMTTTGDTK